MHGHWSRTCRTPKHLTNLYQASLKQNTVEINFIHKDRSGNHNACIDVNIYVDISNFFKNSDKTENMLNGEIIINDEGFVLKYLCSYAYNKCFQFDFFWLNLNNKLLLSYE